EPQERPEGSTRQRRLELEPPAERRVERAPGGAVQIVHHPPALRELVFGEAHPERLGDGLHGLERGRLGRGRVFALLRLRAADLRDDLGLRLRHDPASDEPAGEPAQHVGERAAEPVFSEQHDEYLALSSVTSWYKSHVAKDPKKAAPDPTAARELITKLDRRLFMEELNRLTQGFTADPGNPGSYECTGCARCANCMFCKECEACYNCTHCTRCEL